MDSEKKLHVWQKEGLIDQMTAERILAFEKRQPEKKKLPLLLVIGLIFFTLAVFSFIAANWEMMAAGLKLFLVVLLMWIFYVLAYFSEKQQFGKPIIFRLIGLAMFGACLVIVGQTFHFPLTATINYWLLFAAALAHFMYWRDHIYAIAAFIFGVLLLIYSVSSITWIGLIAFILLAAFWLVKSEDRVPLRFSWLLLFASGFLLWDLVEYVSPYWPIWTLFILTASIFFFPKKRIMLEPLYFITAGLMFIVYLAVRGQTVLPLTDLNMTEATLLLIAGIGISALAFFKHKPLMWIGALGLIGMLMYDVSALGMTVLAQGLGLSYLIIAQRQNKPLTLGFIYFILVQFVVYVIYVWDRIDMSLFFLLGAILLFAFSGIAWWFNRRKGVVV